MNSIREIYQKISNEYKLYRSYVPNYASAALSFYFVMMIVPSLTLLAIFVTGFHLDLTVIKDYLQEIVFPNYADTVINILESRSYSTVAIATAVISLWVVYRGVSMVYSIGNNMFHNENENYLWYLVHSVQTTFFILLLTLGLVFVNVIGPVGELISVLKSVSRIKYLLMIFGLEFIFFCLYLIISRTKNNFLSTFVGANISTICFICVHLFLSYYFKHAHYQSVYGPFSAIIMILFAIRIYAEIFYIGLYIVCRMKNWREKSNGKD